MSSTTDTYLDDLPSVPARFDFDLIGEALAGVLNSPAKGATVIGIHGPWGSGKTTLMYAIRDALRESVSEVPPVVIDFNAWKYQAKEALWRALILRLVGELADLDGPQDKLEELEMSLYRAFEVEEVGPWSINWRNLATEVASVALEVLQLGMAGRFLRRLVGRKPSNTDEPGLGAEDIEQISSALERRTVSRHLVQVASIEQFLETFRELVAELTGSGRQIVVLVDDLDRCLPESALEVFEAIKLFLDAPGCGFVVAVDREVIRNGLAVRYAPLQGTGSVSVADADEYIEKTIGISYDVPRLSDPDVELLIDDADLPLSLVAEQKVLIVEGLGRNPRRVKRFLNLLRVQIDLAARAAKRGHPVPGPLQDGGTSNELSLLLKTMLIGYRFPLLLRRGDLAPLFSLQRAAVSSGEERNPTKAERIREEGFAKMPEPISRLKEDGELWSLMVLGPALHGQHESAVSTYANWFRGTGAGGTAQDAEAQPADANGA